MGQRNVLCYQCNTIESYMVNLNEIKCRKCGSEAVEFVKKEKMAQTTAENINNTSGVSDANGRPIP